MMRIGLFGLSDLGLRYLKQLVNAPSCEVIFATNKAVPRPHAQVFEEEFREICTTHGIPYLGNIDANSDEVVGLAGQTDICIIGGYDRILRKPLLDAPTIGTINTHFSLLPRHRGCNPVTWALLYDNEIGYTTYLVDERIDIGGILDWVSLSNTYSSAKAAYDALCECAEMRILVTLDRLARNEFVEGARLEFDKRHHYHGPGMPNDGWIDWNWDGAFIRRFCAAMTFPPYVGARTRWCGNTYEVGLSNVSDLMLSNKPGKIIEWVGNDGFRVSCADGTVACSLKLLEGKWAVPPISCPECIFLGGGEMQQLTREAHENAIGNIRSMV